MGARSLQLFVVLTLWSSTFLTGCTSQTFKSDACPFPVPSGTKIECGILSVPENRQRPDGPKIQLQVAIVRSRSPHPAADPVVLLNGGPGNSTLDGIDYWLFVFDRLLQERTLILFDPRGVAYSHPSLNCPEVENEWQQDWSRNLDQEEWTQNEARALRACHDRLVAEGVDLSAYTTAANAADVKDLRNALGYPKWDLYGGDYGSRLALEVMREDPAGIRSVILDSTYPPQVNLYNSRTVNLERTLDLLFTRCAADEHCSRSYPDLRGKFHGLADGLDSQPGVYRIYDPSASTFHDLFMNGDRWIWAVSQMFYGTHLAADLPKRIATVQGDMTFSFGRELNQIVSSRASLSEGAYYSIQCAEEMQPTSKISFVKSDADLFPRLDRVLNARQMAQDCSAWDQDRPSSLSRWAVISDIPTLILAGDLDPITPPAWGELAAQTLSRSQFLEFPGFGHGVLGSGPDGGECTFQIVTDFIDRPTQKVASGCIESLNLGFLSP